MAAVEFQTPPPLLIVTPLVVIADAIPDSHLTVLIQEVEA
jgi:hypothetical protein